MPFWVYGRDVDTGEEAEPFFSVASTESEAKKQAESQGLEVDSIEEFEDNSLASLPPVTLPVSFIGATRHLQQAIVVSVVLFVLVLLSVNNTGVGRQSILAFAIAVIVSTVAIWYARRLAVTVNLKEATIEVVKAGETAELYWDEIERIEFRTQSRYQQIASAAMTVASTAGGAGVRFRIGTTADSTTLVGRNGRIVVFPGQGVDDYRKLCLALQQECSRRDIEFRDLMVNNGVEREIDPWA